MRGNYKRGSRENGVKDVVDLGQVRGNNGINSRGDKGMESRCDEERRCGGN